MFIEEQQGYDLTCSWKDKEVHPFSKGISLKVNVKAQLESELAYSGAVVQHFSHYATVTPSPPLHELYLWLKAMNPTFISGLESAGSVSDNVRFFCDVINLVLFHVRCAEYSQLSYRIF